MAQNFQKLSEEIAGERRANWDTKIKLESKWYDKALFTLIEVGQIFAFELPCSQYQKQDAVSFLIKSMGVVKINQFLRKKVTPPGSKAQENSSLGSSRKGTLVCYEQTF